MSALPRIDDRNPGVFEVTDVARDDDLAVNGRCRRDQPISHSTWPPGGEPSPLERHQIADRQDPVAMVEPKLFQPHRQGCGRTGVGSVLERDAFHDFAKGDNAEVDCCRVDRAEPDSRLVAASPSFGQNVGIDEVHQKTTSRPAPFVRALIASTRSSGQAAPSRMWSTIERRCEVSLANSSSETTTTAGSPRTLTV